MIYEYDDEENNEKETKANKQINAAKLSTGRED